MHSLECMCVCEHAHVCMLLTVYVCSMCTAYVHVCGRVNVCGGQREDVIFFLFYHSPSYFLETVSLNPELYC